MVLTKLNYIFVESCHRRRLNPPYLQTASHSDSALNRSFKQVSTFQPDFVFKVKVFDSLQKFFENLIKEKKATTLMFHKHFKPSYPWRCMYVCMYPAIGLFRRCYHFLPKLRYLFPRSYLTRTVLGISNS